MQYQVFESKGRHIYAGMMFMRLENAEKHARLLSLPDEDGRVTLVFIKPVDEVVSQFKNGELIA